ncbi:MAG: DegT/DnrJ/EryC1/StrS family aminotransferase [Chloroflexota bacterium]|jgi:perosamine synthetase
MPVTTCFIPITRPWMDEREAEAAKRAILSGWVTQGPEVAAFESEFATYVGSQYACAVSNGTVALHLALRAAGVGPGDEVITVSHSFIATANAIRYCGAIPVFVDIQPDTFNMDPLRLEKAITGRTKAVLCVHQMGLPCDLEAIVGIAHRRGLPVVEDAACAVGSEVLWNRAWEKIGKPHGDIACFSFHPRKLITTGDGGMLTTSNREWDTKFRLWRQHGMSVSDTTRHNSKEIIFESYGELGYNYRMTDVQAAIGREQLKRLPEVLARRREQAERYRRLLSDIPGLKLPSEPNWARTNWQSYCVRLPEGCDQRQVMQMMLQVGVATRRGIMCIHREPAYDDQPWFCNEVTCGRRNIKGSCDHLRESERAQDNAILIPLFHQMTVHEQDRVVSALYEACFAGQSR